MKVLDTDGYYRIKNEIRKCISYTFHDQTFTNPLIQIMNDLSIHESLKAGNSNMWVSIALNWLISNVSIRENLSVLSHTSAYLCIPSLRLCT